MFRSPEVANFADISKNIVILTNHKKINRRGKNHKICFRMQVLSIYPSASKIPDFRLKILSSAKLRMPFMWFTYFCNLIQLRCNCTNFYHCVICTAGFKRSGAFLPHPHQPWPTPKRPIWIELMLNICDNFFLWNFNSFQKNKCFLFWNMCTEYNSAIRCKIIEGLCDLFRINWSI